MSLLNEALRKNKSVQSQKRVFDFHSPDTPRSKGKALNISVIVVVLIAGFIFTWIYIGNDTDGSEFIEPQTPVISDTIAMDEPGPEHPVTEPEAPEETVEEQRYNTVIPEKEAVKEVPVVTPAPKKSQSISKVSEAKYAKAKEEKKHEVSETKLIDNERNYYRKAVQYHRQGRLEKATSMYKKVLSYNPENSDALFNLASIYITKSMYSNAYNILTELHADFPADSKIILNLAVAEIGLGNNRNALTHLQEVNEKDRGLQFRAAFHKGVALSRLGEQEKAVASYKDAEMLNHDNPALLLNMAVLYDRLGKYKEAIDYYLKLINSDTSDSREKNKFRQRIEILQNNVSKFSAGKTP